MLNNDIKNNHFDFIIVGGGSAGCVLANRLSENPSHSVLMIEAGNNDSNPLVHIPVGAVAMVPTSFNNWAFDTTKQKGLNNRIGYQPRGKVLGGSSSINAMIYARGHADDYNDWAHLGWGWKDVLPYFKKSENNQTISNQYHGNQGPLFVSDSRSNHPVASDFVKAAIENGYPFNDDFNGTIQEGVGRYQVTQHNGQRCSAAKAYIQPIRYRKNLTILTNTPVSKLLFKNKQCIGVEAIIGNEEKTNYYANSEVLLCAGALKSPQVLMLSGIGDVQQLESFDIPVLHELKGVGKNLQDHIDYVSCITSPNTTLFGLSFSGLLHMFKHTVKFLTNRTGQLTSNFAETGGFVKTDASLSRPDIQYHFVVASVNDHARDFSQSIKHGYSLHTCVLRPKSKGAVTLKSARYDDDPNIDPNFLDHPDDLDTLMKGVKMGNDILQHEFMARHQLSVLNNDHHVNDEKLKEIIKQHSDSVYHPIGTCKMGFEEDDMAVVDNKLKVIGLAGLRVVDASVFPNLIGGNTNAPTIMVAERAADFILNR